MRNLGPTYRSAVESSANHLETRDGKTACKCKLFFHPHQGGLPAKACKQALRYVTNLKISNTFILR